MNKIEKKKKFFPINFSIATISDTRKHENDRRVIKFEIEYEV